MGDPPRKKRKSDESGSQSTSIDDYLSSTPSSMPPSTESSKQLQQLAAAVKEQQKKIWILEKENEDLREKLQETCQEAEGNGNGDEKPIGLLKIVFFGAPEPIKEA